MVEVITKARPLTCMMNREVSKIRENVLNFQDKPMHLFMLNSLSNKWKKQEIPYLLVFQIR